MITYTYGPGSYDPVQLQGEVEAAGLPAPAYMGGSGFTVPGGPATYVDVAFDHQLTPSQKEQLDGVVAAHVPLGPRKIRPLWAIRADVAALSPGQFQNVWNDLSAPVAGPPAIPRKYLTDYGDNAGSIFVFDWALYTSGPTAAEKRSGQISLTAMYVQDNPSYLIHPVFDPSITIPGDEPV